MKIFISYGRLGDLQKRKNTPDGQLELFRWLEKHKALQGQ